MANVMRWRYGDTNPRKLTPRLDKAIEMGDLVALVKGEVIAFGDMPANHRPVCWAAAEAFTGVAMQASPVGECQPIRVATTGVFEFAHFGAEMLLPGAWVGPAFTGTKLYSQCVGLTGIPDRMIGRAAARAQGDKLLVDIEVKDRPAETGAEGAAATPHE